MRHVFTLCRTASVLLINILCILAGNMVFGQNVLFISEDDPGSFNSGDQAIYAKLQTMGLTVLTRGSSANPAATSDTAGMDFILISSTINSGTINTKYRDVYVPVIVCEDHLFDDMKMVENISDRYGSLSSQSNAMVVNNNHYLGLPLTGENTLVTSSQSFAYGRPGAKGTIIAHKPGTSDKAFIFVYEAGENMHGMTAPAIRIGFLLKNNTANYLNNDGWRLFENVVNYALGNNNTGAASPRVTDDLVALYTFTEESGLIVNDVSGNGSPADLAIQNLGAVSWLPDHGLTVNSGTIIKATSVGSAKIRAALQATNAFTFEAWIHPANTTQNGPARIVTLSGGTSYRSVTLGQANDDYVTRLRTNSNAGDNNGMPEYYASDVLSTGLQHVVYTRDASGNVNLYVNNSLVKSHTRGGDFSNWYSTHTFALANETSEDRDWLGTFHLVAVYDEALDTGEIDQNYNAGPDGNGQNGTSGSVADGQIRFDRYDNITGSAISDLTSNANYPDYPDQTTYLTTFEIPTNAANDYGAMVSGYVCPPQTGTYTFWVAGDDNSQLWLSTDQDPANASKIAYHTNWTNSQDWDKFTTQESAPIYLESGKCYYVKALMKESGGGDNLAVGWKLPDGTYDRPISGDYLSTIPVNAASSGAESITCEVERYKFNEHAVWINNTSGADGDYYFEDGFGKLEQYEDGTAILKGRVVKTNDSNKKWDVQFSLVNRRNYTDWTALGRGVKGAHLGDETTWYYYELDDSESFMTGLGDFAGKTINITHKPADMHYGFQLGEGANDKNHNYGFSGWFYITGDYTGNGDVNTNASCYAREPEIVEECDINNFDNNQNRFVWMNDSQLGVIKYAWEPGKEGKLVKYDDGSVNFKGCIVATNNANQKWDIDIWYTGKKDWTAWSAQGGDYKVDSWHTDQNTANANYQHWMFYTIDDTRSSFTGKGAFAGETIQIKQRVGAEQYGLQIGLGANDMNGDFGASAWWDFMGDRTGYGDFNMNLDCGSTPPSTDGPEDFYFTCLDGVEVKVFGKGTKGSTSALLSIPNEEFVDSIIVEVVSKGGTPNPSVTFSNEEGQTVTALARTVANSPNGNSCSNCRTYRAVLNGSSKVYASNLNSSNAYSFVAYAFCSGTSNASQTSTGTLVETYFYKGDDTFNLPLATDIAARDLTVYVPITELNNDSRVAIIYATAGGVSVTETFTVPNLGSSLNITPFTLTNVPGNVNQLTIKIESPKGNSPYGDSFVVGGYAFATGTCNETCVLIDGGTITGDQYACGPFDPTPITSTGLPSGGNGTYEYEWRYTEDTSLPFDQWVVKEGANGPDLDLGIVPKTCYLVRLAKKPDCVDYEAASNIIAIEVRKQPTAAFALPINLCAGYAREFTSTYNGADTYAWDFASATTPTASGQTVQGVQWNTPGSYLVRLIVDLQGCADTLEQTTFVDDCTICQNFTDGGAILGSAATCTAPYDPDPISDFTAPSGGGNGAVEYMWLQTVNPNLPPNEWTPIANSNAPTYDPGVLTQTTYFLRCARRGGCGSFLESNVVTVEISENVETLCEASRFSDVHYALQLDNYKVGTANGWYKFQGTSGTFTTYTDGTAKVEGLLEHTENPNQKWFASIWYEGKQDWGNWSAGGGTHYPSGADGSIDQMSWDYYTMDASRSMLIGFDMFQGDTLFLSHHPLNEVLGFQVGVGANGQNPDLGGYGRFAFSGAANGRGRVRINLDNCREVCSSDPLIASKVLFEGLYDENNGEMATDRNVFGMLPLSQPFNVYPYFYSGTESVASIPNNDIVDWVLVEARDQNSPTTIITQMAVFVLKNGELRDLDGITLPVLDVPSGVPYFIAVRSLNHLDIRSNVAKDQMGRAFLHDFRFLTGLNNEAWIPNDPANPVNTDYVGAPSGDLNGDGLINAVDFAMISTNFFFFGYHAGDVDGNGIINAVDYQLVLKNYFYFQHN